MKKLFGIAVLLIAVTLPALAQYRQWQQWNLSSDDQRRYDSYFSRWQDSRQRNDRDEVRSMENRMLDIYAHYNIPAQTPFWRVSSNARSAQNPWRGKLSPGDQSKFDSYFSRWQDYRQHNDRDQIGSMERRMQDLYGRYRIPSGTPYFLVASNSRDDDRDRWEQDRWRGRLTPEDQARFDSYFSRWQDYRRTNNSSEMTSMERRMQDVMSHYDIPQQVPFEQIASR
jgi:hypothetical protein